MSTVVAFGVAIRTVGAGIAIASLFTDFDGRPCFSIAGFDGIVLASLLSIRADFAFHIIVTVKRIVGCIGTWFRLPFIADADRLRSCLTFLAAVLAVEAGIIFAILAWTMIIFDAFDALHVVDVAVFVVRAAAFFFCAVDACFVDEVADAIRTVRVIEAFSGFRWFYAVAILASEIITAVGVRHTFFYTVMISATDRTVFLRTVHAGQTFDACAIVFVAVFGI